MMRIVTEEEKQLVLRYIAKEPEYNLSISGCILNIGMDSPEADVYVIDRTQTYDCVIVQYRNHYYIYSIFMDYDIQNVISFLKDRAVLSIRGKSDLINPLFPYFPECICHATYLARQTTVPKQTLKYMETVKHASIRRLISDDAESIVDFFIRIKELSVQFPRKRQTAIDEILENLKKQGRCYGAYVRNQLACVAITSTENSSGAMISFVATAAPFRKMGLATAVLIRLCQSCFHDGLSYLCISIDNPNVVNIYKQIGFLEIGTYSILWNWKPNYLGTKNNNYN